MCRVKVYIPMSTQARRTPVGVICSGSIVIMEKKIEITIIS